MGTGIKGSDYLVSIDDGSGAMVEVPYQGDATYNPGKNLERSKTKNGVHTYTSEEGATLTFSFEKERPALAAHTRLRTLSDTESLVNVEFGDKNSGGEKRSGEAQILLGEEETGTEGIIKVSVTVAFTADPVIGIVA